MNDHFSNQKICKDMLLSATWGTMELLVLIVGIFYDIPIILCGQISLYNYISYLSIRSLN
jgi:hypothetical protein